MPKMNRLSRSKIKSPQALQKILGSKRLQSQTVVFTNGCFDLVHPGHVAYLESARNQGDLLVVALNADKSVRKLKGSSRPVNVLADRLAVIASLESVDYVTWFSAETPLKVIQLLKPQVLVKGGDWKVDQIVGATDVLSRGGKVKSLKFVKGKSTTGLLKKIKK